LFWTGPSRISSPLARTVGDNPARTCSTRSILLDTHSVDHDYHVLLNNRSRVTLSPSVIPTSQNGSTRLGTCNDFFCIHADTWQLSGLGCSTRPNRVTVGHALRVYKYSSWGVRYSIL
jgi:hypothetical protein